MSAATKLPPPPPEVPVCRRMDGLAPRFRRAVERVLHRMVARGFDPLVVETHRTNERQTFLHGFGRLYDDGRGVVTYSQDADETWHGFWLAVDIVSASQGWNAPAEFWRALEECAEAEGLVCGADWDRNDRTRQTFIDRPHIQAGPPMRRSPSPRAARLRDEGGYEAVWREVGWA